MLNARRSQRAAPRVGNRKRTRGLGGSALQEADYRWYFGGNVAFFIAMQMQLILRGFLAFDLTDQASALGIMAGVSALPLLLVAPFAGVAADRMNKRTLLIVAQTIATLTVLVVTLLALTGLVQFWHLLVTAVVGGVATAFSMPARQALAPILVPRHKIMNAVSLQASGQNVSRILAPTLAGLLIGPIGVGWTYMIATIMFGLAAASGLKLPMHGMKSTRAPASFREDFGEGIRFIRSNRTVAWLIVAGMAFPFFVMPVQLVLPIFAKDTFERGADGLGILAAATGVGGLLGAIISMKLDRYPFKGRIMISAGLWMSALLLAFALSPSFNLAVVILLASFTGGMLFQTTNRTVLQALLPDHVRGRVMSVMLMSMGLMPLGVLPLTFAADDLGIRTAMAIFSIMAFVAIAAVFTLSRPLRTLHVAQLAAEALSPVRAAQLVAEGTLSEREAARITSRLVSNTPKTSAAKPETEQPAPKPPTADPIPKG